MMSPFFQRLAQLERGPVGPRARRHRGAPSVLQGKARGRHLDGPFVALPQAVTGSCSPVSSLLETLNDLKLRKDLLQRLRVEVVPAALSNELAQPNDGVLRFPILDEHHGG